MAGWITLTNRQTNRPETVILSDIGGVERVPHKGEPSSHTVLFIVSESGYLDERLEVSESIEEIGSLIMESLTNSGEEIRND